MLRAIELENAKVRKPATKIKKIAVIFVLTVVSYSNVLDDL